MSHAFSVSLFRHAAWAIVAALALGAAAARASSGDAVELMKQRRALGSGWKSSVTEMKMKIIEANGTASVRQLRQYALEVDGDGNRTINIFLQPKDVDGLAVLTHTHPRGNDDQWLYLPSSQRVKRISSSNRSGAFVGSEFAYEDISGFEVEKYTYGDVSKAQLEGKPVLVISATPAYENSGYSKLRSYLDAQTFQPHKVEFINARGEVHKTLTLGGYKSYGAGGVWRPHLMEMVNHLNGRRTILEFGPYERTSIDAESFNANRLSRVN